MSRYSMDLFISEPTIVITSGGANFGLSQDSLADWCNLNDMMILKLHISY